MEETTLLLWSNFVINYENFLENFYFSEFLWVIDYESTPADKNMFKVDKMVQECYSGVFIISLDNIFEVCGGVWFS